MWLPGWNIQPGLYSLMAATATLGGVFRRVLRGARCCCRGRGGGGGATSQGCSLRAPLTRLEALTHKHAPRRNSISLVVLVMEGTRSIEYMGGIILSVRKVPGFASLPSVGGRVHCAAPKAAWVAH